MTGTIGDTIGQGVLVIGSLIAIAAGFTGYLRDRLVFPLRVVACVGGASVALSHNLDMAVRIGGLAVLLVLLVAVPRVWQAPLPGEPEEASN